MASSPSDGPVSGVDYPSTFLEFQDWFSTDEKCLDYLAGLRWPGGFVCPKCGGTTSWRTSESLWMCTSCSRRTSVTAGTIFDRTRTPLRTWFAAIWFVTSQNNGVSALGLQRVLGLKSYETAWVWMHKLRRAMPERQVLAGTVEVDETYVGGISRGKPGRATDKVPVMIALGEPGQESHRTNPSGAHPQDGASLGHVRAARRRSGIPDQDRRRYRATTTRQARIRAQVLHPTRVHRPDPYRPASSPPSGLAPQAMDDRHHALRGVSGTIRLLSRRVHLPIQPTHLQEPRPALLPAPATSGTHRRAPTENARNPENRRRLHLSRYPVHMFDG